MTTIYVTKYALTSGPLVVDGELRQGASGQYATWQDANTYTNFAHGKEFWLTPEEAIADCERRRNNKLNSLEKQKTKLTSMTFAFSEAKS